MPVQELQDRLVLCHPKGSSVEIMFYGATVVSWKSESKAGSELSERLFVSAKAVLDGSKPVRGGIPIVFPCFGAPTHPDHVQLAQHGFARSELWRYGGVITDDEASVSVRLTLEPTPNLKEKFHRSFELAYVVTLSEHQISTDLHIKNPGLSSAGPLEFQALFHNYIRAPSTEVLVTPLQGVSFYDKTETTEQLRSTPKVETRSIVDVRKFTDFVYENAPGEYKVTWPTGVVEVKTKNFPDVVVWNPQEAGAKIGDMEPNGWDHYICVEPGFVRGFVKLETGDTWIGQQTISIVQ